MNVNLNRRRQLWPGGAGIAVQCRVPRGCPCPVSASPRPRQIGSGSGVGRPL